MKVVILLCLSLSSCFARFVKPDVDLFVRTEDGVKLHIARFLGDGEPVIICHGVGSHGRFFYLHPSVNLPEYLKEQGFDIFVVDLRGVGLSEGGFDFSFEDYIEYDVPAIVDFVLKKTGKSKVHWVGHSMGGMVMYGYLARFGGDKIKTFTAVESPFTMLNYGVLVEIGKREGRRMMKLLDNINVVPFRTLAYLIAPYVNLDKFLEGADPLRVLSFNWMIWNPVNVAPKIKKLASVRGTDNISPKVLKKFLKVILGEDSFPFWGLEDVCVPSLFIVGSIDVLATPKSVRLAYETLGSNVGCVNKEFVVLSRANGFSADYGHTDPFIGKNAKSEVFPIILKRLKR